VKIPKKEPFHAQNDRKQPAAKPFPQECLIASAHLRHPSSAWAPAPYSKIIPTAPSFPMKTIHQKKESKQLPQKKPSMKAKDILFFRIFATQL